MKFVYKTLITILTMSSMVSSAVTPNRITSGQSVDVPSAFEGPFIYVGETTVTYQYLSSDCANETYTSTIGTRDIDQTKTVTVTENQVLTYYLHTPIHYDSTKSYPVVSYMSGDGISIFCDSSIGGTSVNIANFIEGSDYYCLHDKYRQNTSYGNTFINGWGTSVDTQGNYLTSYYEYVGSKKQTKKLPHFCANSGNCDDQFVYDWCDLVYNQNKEEYDCFFLFLQPTDREAFENKSNKKLLTIQNELQAKSICDKYDDNVVIGKGINSASGISTTYISSELSSDPTEQLLCQLIDDLMGKYNIDPARQYVAGFSLGAMFSYDLCCHYPDRFACAITSGLPTLDLTESNVNAWTKTNFWGFNGNSDYCDSNSVYAREFCSRVNAKKEANSEIKARFSVCSGGHNGRYIAGLGTIVDGQTIANSTEVYDFMFDYIKPVECVVNSSSMKNAFNNIKLTAKTSSTLVDDKYDLVIASGSPIGEYKTHGFILEVGANKKSLEVKGQVKEDTVTLGNEIVTVKATDLGSSLMFDYVIRDIPSSVTTFKFNAYVTTSFGTYESKKMIANVSFTGSAIELEVNEL